MFPSYNRSTGSESKPHDVRIVIIGGGVIGVCCAYFLARRGARVIVLERGQIGRGASFGNAGSIAPGHPPINKPGRFRQAVRSLFDPLSPLYIAPRADPELARWLWAFGRTCTAEHLKLSMRTLAPLGHTTFALFDDLIAQERLDCGFRRDGYYEVFLTQRGVDAARREADFVARYGFHPEEISADALRDSEPAFNRQVVGALFHPEAATINPYRFVLELASRAVGYGAEFRTGSEVVEIWIEDGRTRGIRARNGERIEADAVVLATGAYGSALMHKLGLRLPVQAAKGYHRDCEPAAGRPPLLRHACVLGENLVFCTPMDGYVRFAGTLEFSGVNHEIRRPRLEQLTRAAKRYLNRVEEATSRSEWCGLRPCLPDGLPAVGPVSKYPGLFIATGHAMAGLTLGPVTGKLIAECILDGAPSLEIAALRPERFQGGKRVTVTCGCRNAEPAAYIDPASVDPAYIDKGTSSASQPAGCVFFSSPPF